MSKKFSFTHLEKEFSPEFRERVNACADITDLSNLFSHTVSHLLNKVFPDLTVANKDVVFDPDSSTGFRLSARLAAAATVKDMLANSDLGHVVGKFASAASHRCQRLKKHHSKKEMRIRK